MLQIVFSGRPHVHWGGGGGGGGGIGGFFTGGIVHWGTVCSRGEEGEGDKAKAKRCFCSMTIDRPTTCSLQMGVFSHFSRFHADLHPTWGSPLMDTTPDLHPSWGSPLMDTTPDLHPTWGSDLAYCVRI